MMGHMTISNHFFAKWSFWPLNAKIDCKFDHGYRMFWFTQITCFLLIYSKPYNHSKTRILNSKSIGRFFLTQFSSHVTRKRENERSMHMRNVISNIRSEKTKIFHVRVSRIVSPSDFDRMDISWSSHTRRWKRRKYAYGYFI